MFLINGYKKKHLIANDRSIQFGDGIFTTARIFNGKVCLYDAHLRRLKNDCKKLFIPFVKWNILKTEIHNLSQNVELGILKVIISRGSSNIGYSIKKCYQPNRILSVSQYPLRYEEWRKLGIKLIVSPIRIGCNKLLAGVKHLNRLEQVLIRAHLDRSASEEAIVLDNKGIIIECCSANLFWRYGYNIFTPKLEQSGIHGVMREFFLKQLAHSRFNVIKIDADLHVLSNADEILICNSLMLVIPVRFYKGRVLKSRKLYEYFISLCKEFLY